MESKQRNVRWSAWVGSLAVALLLFGGTSAYALSQFCYACGTGCIEFGVNNGFSHRDINGNIVKVGGTGFALCGPGGAPGSAKDLCFRAVQARCSQLCTACMNNGGYYGHPPGDPEYLDCSSNGCSIDTSPFGDGRTSVCSAMCICRIGTFCKDTQIFPGGLVSTENVVCACPP